MNKDYRNNKIDNLYQHSYSIPLLRTSSYSLPLPLPHTINHSYPLLSTHSHFSPFHTYNILMERTMPKSILLLFFDSKIIFFCKEERSVKEKLKLDESMVSLLQ